MVSAATQKTWTNRKMHNTKQGIWRSSDAKGRVDTLPMIFNAGMMMFTNALCDVIRSVMNFFTIQIKLKKDERCEMKIQVSLSCCFAFIFSSHTT